MTLELSLDRRASCSEIAAGTAITVGVEPSDTETRVASGFVTARTSDCDPVTNRIGTLVVTPSDPGKASVIVVVGYQNNDPTACKPPRYDGCIVARRRFAFAEHTRLRMPITIDPDCAGVPCDAFSTCNKGRCYDSETSCSGSECGRPGELEDGGIDEAGQVEPDTSGFDATPPIDSGSTDSGPTDSGRNLDTDAGPLNPDAGGTVDGGGGTPPYCMNNNDLHCDSVSTCNGANNGACCAAATGQGVCNLAKVCMPGQTRYCCSDTDCSLPDGGKSTCLRDVVAMPGPALARGAIPAGGIAAGTCQ